MGVNFLDCNEHFTVYLPTYRFISALICEMCDNIENSVILIW